MDARRHRRARARPRGQRPRRVRRRPAVARGHARVRAGLRRRAQLRRGAPARQQQRRLRGLPARAPLPGHVEPERSCSARCARSRASPTRARVGVDGMSPGMHALFARARSRRPSSSTPGPILAELWRVHVAREDRRRARSRARRVQRARGDGRVPPRRRARTRAARRVRRALRVARRHDPRVRSGRRADRRRRVHLAAARAAARRGRERRAARRRAAQRLGSVARAHVRGRRPVDRAAAARRLGRARCALCRPGTRVGQLRDLDAVVYGVGRGVEPYDDDLALEVGMVFALELHRGQRLHQDVLHLTDDGAS